MVPNGIESLKKALLFFAKFTAPIMKERNKSMLIDLGNILVLSLIISYIVLAIINLRPYTTKKAKIERIVLNILGLINILLLFMGIMVKIMFF